MINLLPDETKRNLRAARLNVLLLRYLIFLGVACLFIVGAFGVGYLLTASERTAAARDLAASQQTLAAYQKTKLDAQAFADNLRAARIILSNETIFSDLIVQIAKTLPPNTVLTSLNLSTDTLGKQIIINARTKDAEAPLALKTALENSPLFTNVSILTIAKPSPSDPPPRFMIARDYPVTVTMSATLVKPPARSQP
ncbi:MAG: hypothetical protein EOT04_00540 [Candidatus Chaera renei]|uniref:Fimbrial assembly protein n=1 Tax=Candidatus Chaera renei TaxID=2506947 RepID=A0A4Q0AJK9_9BACT|nr:MAG: hypothetical protein EOT04_00540 [Candidatus Chaera renei]